MTSLNGDDDSELDDGRCAGHDKMLPYHLSLANLLLYEDVGRA